MRVDDDASYTTATFTDDTGTTQTNAQVWNYGKEIWCNMEGRYMSIVADLTSLSSESSYEMSLCSVGILGTKYSRATTLPTPVIQSSDTYEVFTIDAITADPAIGNTLDIAIRLATSHSWLTIITDASVHYLVVDAKSAPVGTHTVELESYDKNSSKGVGNESTLKKDSLTITVPTSRG